MTAAAFIQNVGKVFSNLKVGFRELFSIYAVANSEVTTSGISKHDLGILTNPFMVYLPKKCTSFLQKFSIANNVEATLLPGCSHHQTVSLPKKPNLLLAVATHQAQYDDIRFMALCHTKNMIAVV